MPPRTRMAGNADTAETGATQPPETTTIEINAEPGSVETNSDDARATAANDVATVTTEQVAATAASPPETASATVDTDLTTGEAQARQDRVTVDPDDTDTTTDAATARATTTGGDQFTDLEDQPVTGETGDGTVEASSIPADTGGNVFDG